jgi:hypothetical protein
MIPGHIQFRIKNFNLKPSEMNSLRRKSKPNRRGIKILRYFDGGYPCSCGPTLFENT